MVCALECVWKDADRDVSISDFFAVFEKQGH